MSDLVLQLLAAIFDVLGIYSGIVIDGTGAAILEDSPLWECSTMGNGRCN